MTDADLRGHALKLLYDHRGEELTFAIGNDAFSIPPQIEPADWLRACEQLAEKGLIHWRPVYFNTNGGQRLALGDAKISAAGVDVVEGTATAPIAVHFDQRQNITVNKSQGVQIAGPHSQQQMFADAFQKLISDIDATSVPPQDKQEAKGRFKTFLESKAVIAVLGPLAGALVKKLFE